jgi:hypothetical protein
MHVVKSLAVITNWHGCYNQQCVSEAGRCVTPESGSMGQQSLFRVSLSAGSYSVSPLLLLFYFKVKVNLLSSAGKYTTTCETDTRLKSLSYYSEQECRFAARFRSKLCGRSSRQTASLQNGRREKTMHATDLLGIRLRKVAPAQILVLALMCCAIRVHFCHLFQQHGRSDGKKLIFGLIL